MPVRDRAEVIRACAAEWESQTFTETFFCRRCDAVASIKTCPHADCDPVALSGTRVRELLKRGDPLPREFTRPEVAAVLAEWARSG